MDYDEKMKPDTQALVDAWNKQQSGSQVELNVLSWNEGPTVLLQQVSAGQAPDIANGNAQMLGKYAGIGEITPMGDVMPKDFLAVFQPSALKAFTVKGVLEALPYFLDPRFMYYRSDLFDSNGLKPPQTWDEVIAAGQKLNKPPDMTGIGLTFSRKSDDLDYFIYAWLGVLGGDANLSMWDDNGKSRLGSPEAIKAVQFLNDLSQKYKITNNDIPAAGRDDGLQPLFFAGKLAMLETGSWFPTLLKSNAPDIKYAIGPIPMSTASLKPVTAFWPDCVMLFKQSKNTPAAVDFLQYMFDKPNRLLFAKQRGVVPERIDVGQDPAYATGPNEKLFVQALDTAFNAYTSPFPANLYDNFTIAENAIDKAVVGEAPVEQALKDAASQIDQQNGVS